MGKEKDKKPLFGGIFQKFFKPSAKAEAKKKKEHHLTVQRSIPYLEMGRDGICRVEEHLYSKTVRFYDINYQLAQNEDKNTIFESWCDFLNYFDSSIRFQLSFINHKSDMSEYNKVIQIEPQHDQFDDVRMEYAQMLKQQLAKGNNGLVRTKYITFSIEAKSVKEAKPRLERIETDILNNFKVLGVKAYPLNGVERLQIMYEMFHQEEERKFEFSYDRILQSGMTTKDFIAPTSFLFKSGKDFQMGDTIGAVSYLNILAPELTDKVLAEFLDMDKNLVVSIHVQSVDQLKAIKLIKGKITDLDRMKIEEQKKAVRSGYDMEIIPSDLATYGGEAKKILDDLQSRNERMFLITVLFLNAAKTKQDLDSAVFQTAGIAQKFNCTLNRLDYLQEQGLMSSLPLANNLVPIKRALTTTSTAIFVPFTTQELFMEGDSLYYGLNAVSNNMIMADRKQLKNPNGLILGTPGSGKSFSAKREMTNVFFTTTDDIIIADPEGEYYPLVEALGGQVIHISSTSRDYINPMDINLNYADDDNPLGMKSDFILSLCELIMGARDGMEPEEKSVIDRCLPLVYQKYLNDPKPENMPILGDLYDCLREQKERQAQRIATALEIYVNGSLRVFNHQTNVELDNRLICFDIKELGKQLKKLAESVAELAMAHMFSCARYISHAGYTMRNGQWEKKAYGKGIELCGKTLGVVGFGRIGQKLGVMAKAIGMNVIAFDIFHIPGIEEQLGIPYVEMDELLAKADFISVHAPAVDGGALINAERIAKMKDGVVIINTSRGTNVDEAALLAALESGKVRAAGLDVYADEPATNKALYSHPMVSCTPHIGAATNEAQKRIGAEIVDIIKAM